MYNCKMAAFYSVDEIFDKQCEKLRNLETTTIFIKSKDVMKEEFLQMRTTVSQMYGGIETMRKKLNKVKDQNNQCKDLLTLIEELDKRIIHMGQNVAAELIHDYTKNVENSLFVKIDPVTQSPVISKEIVEQDATVRDCKKMLFKEPEICPSIPLISQDEFSKVPKYIIGRQSLDTVNNLIHTINVILRTKYTFLALGKAHARKQGDLNLYLHYKKQDLDICNKNETLYFFTSEDYEKHTNSKINKKNLNLLTVLRHCKRIREHRVKNDLRYVLLAKK